MKNTWIKKTSNIKIKRDKNKLIIENDSNKPGMLIYPKLFKFNTNFLNLKYVGRVIRGSAPKIKLINKKRKILSESIMNVDCIIEKGYKKYFLMIMYVNPKSKCEIDDINVEFHNEPPVINVEEMVNDTLVIAPGYPSENNKYMMGFVHTRVKEYKNTKLNVDVVVVNPTVKYSAKYNYEGIEVNISTYSELRNLLTIKQYKRIIVHFFDEHLANIFDSIDLSKINLYFFSHGADTLYWDWNKIAMPYFKKENQITPELRNQFMRKDEIIKKYNSIPNVKWVFVTGFTRKRSEELLGIKYNNSEIISCNIDFEKFKFEKKDTEARKKIVIVRKFDDINSYSIDTAVRTIIELSRRNFFNELEIDFYGEGTELETLLEPVKKFDNVKIHRKFLNHDQLQEVYKKHGIALLPTRFDSQAVTTCEAASTGCVTITSDVEGILQFFPKKLGIVCEKENYLDYANKIEELYNNPKKFLTLSKTLSDIIKSTYSYDLTIKKELDMYKAEKKLNSIKISEIDSANLLLTIVIPSYNVEKYLKHGIMSLLNQKNAHKIEILVVNDGSSDKTATIAKEFEKITDSKGVSVVKLIDKKNGGHGSTINMGLKLARGKYFKVMDGDDAFDSEGFEKLIDLLENENTDIILNNYMEDFASTNELNVKKIYEFMSEGVLYNFDDLCYENYGFSSWGPILSCSTYKTSMLRKGKLELSEKCFYVDMELNTFVALHCKTIKHYDINLYRYLLGRPGQSVNKDSYKKRYKDHERVTMNIIRKYIDNQESLSENRRRYIYNKLITPMVTAQYYITLDYHSKKEPFLEFEKELKKFQSIYNDNEIMKRKVKFFRLFNGMFFKLKKCIWSILRGVK